MVLPSGHPQVPSPDVGLWVRMPRTPHPSLASEGGGRHPPGGPQPRSACRSCYPAPPLAKLLPLPRLEALEPALFPARTPVRSHLQASPAPRSLSSPAAHSVPGVGAQSPTRQCRAGARRMPRVGLVGHPVFSSCPPCLGHHRPPTPAALVGSPPSSPPEAWRLPPVLPPPPGPAPLGTEDAERPLLRSCSSKRRKTVFVVLGKRRRLFASAPLPPPRGSSLSKPSGSGQFGTRLAVCRGQGTQCPTPGGLSSTYRKQGPCSKLDDHLPNKSELT